MVIFTVIKKNSMRKKTIYLGNNNELFNILNNTCDTIIALKIENPLIAISLKDHTECVVIDCTEESENLTNLLDCIIHELSKSNVKIFILGSLKNHHNRFNQAITQIRSPQFVAEILNKTISLAS